MPPEIGRLSALSARGRRGRETQRVSKAVALGPSKSMRLAGAGTGPTAVRRFSA